MKQLQKHLWQARVGFSCASLLLLGASSIGAAAPLNQSATGVHYQLDLQDVAQNYATITLSFHAATNQPMTLVMASASPGRYARHDFAKNIIDIKAFDANNKPLKLERSGVSNWQLWPTTGTVQVRYRLFADHADGTYSQLDASHAHLNMPASFLFVPDHAEQPISLTVRNQPTSWQVASQLQRQQPAGGASTVYQAKNLQEFMDSPLEISAHERLTFSQMSNGQPYQIAIALHHQGTQAQAQHLQQLVQGFVKEQQAIFGELPPFAEQRYTFIADYLPWVTGDGMEHRNSTIVTDDRSLLKAEYAQVETMSHEFFHAWNVERIRPKSLEPFDFTKPNQSDLLWFSEGFTNYYGKLALKRSGYFSQTAFFQQLAKPLNRTLQAPGRRYMGPAAMSQQAVFVDAGVSVDATDYGNNYLSYYTYGEVIALGLDLELRTRFNTNLDALMRQMWQQFGKTETPFSAADLEQQLALLTQDAKFARSFFAKSIEQSELPDFKQLFAKMGLQLKPVKPSQAYAGQLNFTAEGKAVMVASRPWQTTPWSQAGVGLGDQIVQLGDYPITQVADIEQALSKAKPGDSLQVIFRQKDQLQTAQLKLVADPTLEIVATSKPSSEQQALLQSWLASQAITMAVR